MATTASPTPAQMPAVISPKEQFLAAFEQEHATTMRVLRAYPADKSELQPHPKSKSARDLAFTFVLEMAFVERALTAGFDWSQPPAFPETPPSLEAIIDAFEQGHKRVADIIAGLRDDQLFETVKFFVAPKTIGDVPKIQFMWMNLCDQIHHRGQLSVYLRMAEGKVPSIYGPTADEPWM
ncbi:MAG TPA: DinB family protein [Gemmatimonadaceae bacterium]|nr:DinB family protein [Gemmatimonadaceae bacterium]